jgi:hypothetical protein
MVEIENKVLMLFMLPPNLFLERFTSNKDEKLDQNQLGTWPCREFSERSIICNFDMFLR